LSKNEINPESVETSVSHRGSLIVLPEQLLKNLTSSKIEIKSNLTWNIATTNQCDMFAPIENNQYFDITIYIHKLWQTCMHTIHVHHVNTVLHWDTQWYTCHALHTHVAYTIHMYHTVHYSCALTWCPTHRVLKIKIMFVFL